MFEVCIIGKEKNLCSRINQRTMPVLTINCHLKIADYWLGGTKTRMFCSNTRNNQSLLRLTPVFGPQCGSTGCLGLARFLSDCQSCLVFSGTPASLARAPGEFGWCVQNESCLPVSGETQGGRGGREGRRRTERGWVPSITKRKMLGDEMGGI